MTEDAANRSPSPDAEGGGAGGVETVPPRPGEPRGDSPGSVRSLGRFSILLFLIYLLLLAVLTAYALWTIWPYENAGPTVLLFGFTLDFQGSDDARLLVIAALSGLLGAFIHTATSLTTYLGNRTLVRSWVPWYLLRPAIGMAVGILIYFLVRAGLVTSAGAATVNPFGIAAISGLAGLFSKQAIDKLREAFESLLPTRADEERKDKLDEEGSAGSPGPPSAAGTGGGDGAG